jgi:hypothetical protein
LRGFVDLLLGIGVGLDEDALADGHGVVGIIEKALKGAKIRVASRLRWGWEDGPHRALELRPPEPEGDPGSGGSRIYRHDRLGGLIHEYYRAAA